MIRGGTFDVVQPEYFRDGWRAFEIGAGLCPDAARRRLWRPAAQWQAEDAGGDGRGRPC